MKVKLILLHDQNVITKEVITPKPIAYLRGILWKYNTLSNSKRDYIIADA
jgi:hypothetical protein